MASMLIKNALKVGLRARKGNSSMHGLYKFPNTSFSIAFNGELPSSPVLSMPTNHMSHAFVRHPLVFKASGSRFELGEFPQQIELPEYPTESLNGKIPAVGSQPLQAIKRTYQPSVLRRKRKHGFRTRRVSISGRKVLKRRFTKGRWRMSL
ncbi:hypothetical protein CCR75_008107 [Bremia lactucae]|uniref:Large ribosomal subunit protein bL34m n=1 Tax=Bremia lactucae TaxID=4779 RepID=A0A976FMK8_BRELC|nr:hypothetical protein CCR75_008107 [Bremia lactucae]